MDVTPIRGFRLSHLQQFFFRLANSWNQESLVFLMNFDMVQFYHIYVRQYLESKTARGAKKFRKDFMNFGQGGMLWNAGICRAKVSIPDSPS
jgi:hypothetical protein